MKVSLLKNSVQLLYRLSAGYLRGHRLRLVVAVMCMLVVSACTALVAYMVKPLMDEIFVARNADMLLLIPLAIVGIYAVKGVASYIQSYQMEYVGQRLVADLQIDLFKHVLRQDYTFFQAHTTGDLSARFLFDLHRLKQAISQTITGSLRDFTMMIGLIAVMFVQDWQMSLLALLAFPLLVYPLARFSKHMRRYAAGTQEEMGELAGILRESFGYNRQVKAYNMEEREAARASGSINRVFVFMVKAARVRALSSPVMEMLGGLSMAGIILYGGHRVIDGVITTGAFFSFLTALMSLYRPVKGLTNMNNTLQEGLAAAERTFTLLDVRSAVQSPASPKALEKARGEVSFDNVSFSYTTENGEKRDVLSGISFTVQPGQSAAFVGLSGAGKSTLLNLIPRFFDPVSGEITLDGTPVTGYALEALRAQVALVSQEVALFNDTVAANIALGRPDATQEEIENAARAAAAHSFIEQLPQGYQTQVGEEGNRLSGGQRQRITIARAFLKDAPILLLDEATSNLDGEAEQQVHIALQQLMQGRTTLIVAHRLSTVRKADCIYVLENGRIVEQGSHAALLAAGGAYAKMYTLMEHDDEKTT